jgi:hypothetical protein
MQPDRQNPQNRHSEFRIPNSEFLILNSLTPDLAKSVAELGVGEDGGFAEDESAQDPIARARLAGMCGRGRRELGVDIAVG